MIELLENSDRLVQRVSLDFKRYLAGKIDWNSRLIGIKGARGTGKTTLLLQWLKEKGMQASKAACFSLDDLYFLTNSLVETAKTFFQQGGQILVLDEVHKYPQWAREIKIIYDRYPELQIIFTGSSIIDISRQEADLSRRALMYELHGLSYREYLTMNGMKSLPILTLNQMTESNNAIRSFFPSDFRPFELFNSYLQNGYYPFSREDLPGYFQRLQQLVRLIVEYDMAEIQGFDIRNAKKMLQLLYVIAQQVPFKPNLLKLSEKSGIHRNSMGNYLYFLEEARLIRLLYPAGISIATLQKPEKIFLNNTNLLFAIASGNPLTGTIRETFAYSHLIVNHAVKLPKSGDFEIDASLILEIGGPNKSTKQISGLPEAFLVKDDLEYPVSNVIPLWLLGFLY